METFGLPRISILCLFMLHILFPPWIAAEEQDPTYAFIFGDYTVSIFDLPRHFQACYHHATLTKIQINSHTPRNASLTTHVNYILTDVEALDFSELPYKWMILQENRDFPAMPNQRIKSTIAAIGLNYYAEQHAVKTMFLMTWGYPSGFVQEGVSYPDFLSHNKAIFDGYQGYVNATSSPQNPTFLAPVGLVFETIYNDCVDENISPLSNDCLFSQLFTGDNYPSMYGTYVAGLTLATAITGYDPLRQSWLPVFDGYQVDPDVAEKIRHAVSRTILQTFLSGLILYPWFDAWPTAAPSSHPTSSPRPSSTPSDTPSSNPSYAPSLGPSSFPSLGPSYVPSPTPSSFPSVFPSGEPSTFPSDMPSTSAFPSNFPSREPSSPPSDQPSLVPSDMPSVSGPPSNFPSLVPSSLPSSSPSAAPSYGPSSMPTISQKPSSSFAPSDMPSFVPSITPSASLAPSKAPSINPSQEPSMQDHHVNVTVDRLQSHSSGSQHWTTCSAVSGAVVFILLIR